MKTWRFFFLLLFFLFLFLLKLFRPLFFSMQWALMAGSIWYLAENSDIWILVMTCNNFVTKIFWTSWEPPSIFERDKYGIYIIWSITPIKKKQKKKERDKYGIYIIWSITPIIKINKVKIHQLWLEQIYRWSFVGLNKGKILKCSKAQKNDDLSSQILSGLYHEFNV